jgi:general secretion pathway protein H
LAPVATRYVAKDDAWVRCHAHVESGWTDRGYTLLELLVVIAILGIVAGMVSLSVAPTETRKSREEVNRLAVLFRLASDEARISGEPIAWQADANGYRFVQSDGVRGESDSDDPLRPRAWPFEVRSLKAPEVVFGREPLMTPAQIQIVTTSGEIDMDIDAFGELEVAH